MKKQHLKLTSKKSGPATATGCAQHNDDTFKGTFTYRLCMKGKKA